MGMQWYALRSKPNREEALWREAGARGFDVYYPMQRVHPVNPRSRRIKPYFPGYLFVQTDIGEIGTSTFAWMPYSNGIVEFGAEPAAVPEGLVNAIRRRVDEINDAGGEVFDGLQRGEIVTIQGGPFAGSQAIFDARASGTDRVRVLLRLLSRQEIPLELSAGQIQRKNRH
jgi:transcription antitermination factor NusG